MVKTAILIMCVMSMASCATTPQAASNDYCESITLTALTCQAGQDIELPTALHVEVCILGVQLRDINPRKLAEAIYGYCKQYLEDKGL